MFASLDYQIHNWVARRVITTSGSLMHVLGIIFSLGREDIRGWYELGVGVSLSYFVAFFFLYDRRVLKIDEQIEML